MLPDESDTTLIDGSTVAMKLRQWGTSEVNPLCAHMVSHEVAQLIVQGLFSTIIALARCPTFGEIAEHGHQIQEWIASSRPVHKTVTDEEKTQTRKATTTIRQ